MTWHTHFFSTVTILASTVSLTLACGQGLQPSQPIEDLERTMERNEMVNQQMVRRGVKNPAVLEAMRRIPRHQFILDSYTEEAYEDHPLPIGYGQTISQPYIVAFMTEALELKGDEKVLEIGTGSGYQAAILAELTTEVFTIEIVEPLAAQATNTLKKLGYHNVTVRAGDGYQGWPEEAPFDAIILTAAPDHVPQPLLDQLAVGGRMILPVGKFSQQLILFRRTETGLERTNLLPVMFVPMTGEAE
ncbi:MAG: protein-L-isoaspartate(D-aspartate) O-methyltransferase [Nitrospirae bacterium]|nr:protein-L-isoaspartate(D-aspartate) O-methyltransferase [Nitrospirota bacterium]